MSPQNKLPKLLKRPPQVKMVAYSGKSSLISSLNVKHLFKVLLQRISGGDRSAILKRKTPPLWVKKVLQPETIQLTRKTMLMPQDMALQPNHMGMKILIRSLWGWLNNLRCFRKHVKARSTRKLKMSLSRRWLRNPSLNHLTQWEPRSQRLPFLSIKVTL